MEVLFLTAAAMHISRWNNVWSPGLLGNKCHFSMNGLSKLMNGVTEKQLPPQNGTAFKAFWFKNLHLEQLVLKSQRISWTFWGSMYRCETQGIGTSTGFCGFNGAYAWPGKRLNNTPHPTSPGRKSNFKQNIFDKMVPSLLFLCI